MRVISIANQKGGCGKTTTAINLSGCLVHKGKKVLLIDMDPQGHSAVGLNIKIDELNKTMFEALSHSGRGKTPLNDVTLKITKNFDIAPSNISLSTFDQHLSMVKGRETRLRDAIYDLNQSYDYIIIDCPPSLGLLTFNSLIASQEVIVPIEMSLFSLHGISKLMEIIDLVRRKTGHEIHLKVIATLYDRRTRMSREVLQNIQKHFKKSAFSTIINMNVTLKEAASFGKPIVDYAQSAQGFKDYMALTKEVIAEEKKRTLKLKNQKRRPAREEKEFHFYAPDAGSVKIVGNFNDWSVTDDSIMERCGDGTWSTHLSLDPGIYQYKFLVDGEWVEDKSNASKVENSFGGINSIIEI